MRNKGLRTPTRRPARQNETRRSRKFFGLERLDPRVLMSGTIISTVAQDVNGNGIRDAEDTGLAGWTVYLDLNKNAAKDAGEPSALTDSSGIATIGGLADSTYDVREIIPSGWVIAPNFNPVKRISVHNGNSNSVLFLNKSNLNGTIQGSVWNDINGDGVRAPGDAGLPGWTVFIDANKNRLFDPGEINGVTDASGNYSLGSLAPGSYRVREVLQPNYSASLGFSAEVGVGVSSAAVTTQDFGNFNIFGTGTIGGSVWNDNNANGVRDIGDGSLSGWTVFIDSNSNGTLDAGEPSLITDAGGAYKFTAVLPGTYAIREVPQAGWTLSPTFHNPTPATITGTALSDITVDFANFTPVAGSTSGTVYNDLNGDGFQSVGEPGNANWTVYVDANSNGVLDTTEASTTTDANGNYTLSGLSLGSYVIRDVPKIGWIATAPGTGAQLLTLLNGAVVTNINFGNQQRVDGAIRGVAFVDSNKNGVRDTGERGLAGITVYLDTNNNGALDVGEPSTITSADLFYTPAVDEAGTYTFTHLRSNLYHVREIVPDLLSATPVAAAVQDVDLLPGEDRTGVNFADVYRSSEIHGVKYNDLNRNHVRDAGEPGMGGVTVYLDLNRNNTLDAGEPSTVTDADGNYSFTGLAPGAYVAREVLPSGHEYSYPATTGGILWPGGVSNAPIGNVSPLLIQQSLTQGQTYTQTVSLTLPTTGALTNKADVFLLFDDTGSFTGNSPIVRAAFPEIIAALQASLPGLDLGFGVGRFEEYGNFAAEFGTGRPFILNQPVISSTTPGFDASIGAALNRTTPGYGGDQPETDIEALFQMVTGKGFDGNNNGTTTDSGAAGLAQTQINPGVSGDVPAFSSFTPDSTDSVLPAQGVLGGAGFRDGALPIILTATDTGFAYQPNGETTITGVNGITVPVSSLTQTSRPSTPFGSGAGLQQTVTGLNALGALVIGLGTNAQTNLDPRQGLESLAKLTGAVNHSLLPITNGTGAPINPGDPLYFQIATGFSASVASGVVSAIQSAATSVAVNVTLKASDPRVHITFTPGAIDGLTAGQTATFNVTFTGDGMPHRFDLQFVRDGTNVVLGSIPVVLGTPVVGDGYEYEDVGEGEIHHSSGFASSASVAVASSIAGQTYVDTNGNGSFDTGETALDSVTIYADLDNSGSFTAGDISTVTSGGGLYTISGLTPGSYTLRQLSDSTHAVTNVGGNIATAVTTAGASVVGQNFGSISTVFSSTGPTSNFYVKASGTQTQIWLGASPVGTPDFSIATSALPSLSFTGTAGGDSLTIDDSAGNIAPAGGITFNAGTGLDSLTVIGSTGNDAIVTSGTSVSVNGTTTSFPAGMNLTLNPDGGNDSLKIGSGAVHLAARSGAGLTTRLFSNLSITAGATLSVDTPPSQTDRSVLVASTLSIDPTATLDLGGNDLIVRNGVAAGALDKIVSGFNAAAGFWNGNGIRSSVAAAGSINTLAAIRNTTDGSTPLFGATGPLGLFDGQDAGPGDVLVKFTYVGDANLDGIVDGSDYTRIDAAFGTPATGELNGDFNYDGTIDGSDYTLIDNAFNTQGAALSAASVASQIAAPTAQLAAPAVPSRSSTTENDEHHKRANRFADGRQIGDDLDVQVIAGKARRR